MRKHLIKVIHAIKSEKKISDTMYRGILSDRFDVESSKELSINQLYALAVSFGYAVPFSKIKVSSKGKCTKAQIDTINSLFYKVAREKTPLALRNFICKITGKRPLHINQLQIKEAQKVIIALKAWQKRVEGD